MFRVIEVPLSLSFWAHQPHGGSRNLSLKVNLPYAIHVRALYGANLVTYRSKNRTNETDEVWLASSGSYPLYNSRICTELRSVNLRIVGDRLRALGGVPREQKMLKGHLPRVIYHQA